MERGVWLLAAWMVHRHGFDAPFAVDRKISELLREKANDVHIGVWRQIGQAVLEITRAAPNLRERVH
jgi:hypothetical protein